MSRYQAEYRGLVEYYQMANNLNRLKSLRWVMEVSLTKTLAAKLKLTVPKVYKTFRTTHLVDGKPYKGLHVLVERKGIKPPLIAKWGNIPLKRKPRKILNDQPQQIWTGHTELEKRLLADTCELCGSHEKNFSPSHSSLERPAPERGRETTMDAHHGLSTPKNLVGLLVVPYGHSTWPTTQNNQRQKQYVTGEPVAMKVARRVRRGGVEKGHSVYLVGVLLYHMAHEKREDGCHSPAAVLQWIKGVQPEPERMYQAFFALCETRRLNKAGYARFRNFFLYGERNLAGETVLVDIFQDVLTLTTTMNGSHATQCNGARLPPSCSCRLPSSLPAQVSVFPTGIVAAKRSGVSVIIPTRPGAPTTQAQPHCSDPIPSPF